MWQSSPIGWLYGVERETEIQGVYMRFNRRKLCKRSLKDSQQPPDRESDHRQDFERK